MRRTVRTGAVTGGAASAVLDDLQRGVPPSNDGWTGVYRLVDRIATPTSRLRRALCRYFLPSRLECAGGGRLYRVLGVAAFGRYLPTGGIGIRRVTGARMAPYTLARPTRRAARDFYFRACAFEAAHLPFFLTLTALSLQRASVGRIDLALADMVVNVAVNLYPMMHHRHTRVRIVRLLSMAASRPHGRRGPRFAGSSSRSLVG